MSWHEDETVTVLHGDCIEVMRSLPDDSVDSIVTDPPYGLGFMGRAWDSLPPGLPWAQECLRVLKPGGHLLAFGGTRTWHRLAVAVEDAGFEVRDSIAWLYSQGFPKSLNVGKDQRFCRCGPVPYNHGDDQLRGVRPGVPDVAADAPASEVTDVLTTVQRRSPGQGVGVAREQGVRGADTGKPGAVGHVRGEEPGVEGRRDVEAPEGELLGGAVRPLPGGVPGDGAQGRVHHGAPAGDGAVDRAPAPAVGSGEPQGSRPVEQRPGEPGTVPVERGPQAGRGWPVCGGCGKPSVPAGLGTALKPSFEPVVVARKPLVGTVAGNVLAFGTGALNIDGCRVDATAHPVTSAGGKQSTPLGYHGGAAADGSFATVAHPAGRWPANVVLDGTQADALDAQSGTLKSGGGDRGTTSRDGLMGQDSDRGRVTRYARESDSGGASRFFPTFRYQAKAPTSERPKVDGVAHATVKPLALMRWLVRLVTPPGGLILEPFAGSGTTVEAAMLEGFRIVAIEREADYLPLILARINRVGVTPPPPEPAPSLLDLIEGDVA